VGAGHREAYVKRSDVERLLPRLGEERTDEDWDFVVLQALDRAVARGEADDTRRGDFAWLLAGRIADYQRDVAALQAALTRWRERDINANGAGRFGDTWVTVAPATTREIPDGVAFVAWLADAAHLHNIPVEQIIGACFNLNGRSLRVTALRELAERLHRERHPDATSEEAEAYARTVEDTFIRTERNETKLQEKPIDKAPAYAQRLAPGQRVGWPTGRTTT
jgi:hypothetical protein